MKTERLVDELKGCLAEIDQLKKIKEGINHPQVKAWRAHCLKILQLGGKACTKAHKSMKSMQFISRSYEDTFVGQQSYLNQHEAMQKILSQTIMTLELFGRPEDKGELPQWRPPANSRIVQGHILIDGMAVEPDSVTIVEMFRCFELFVKDSDALTREMQENILEGLTKILGNDLYRPFMSQTLDKLFAHWPNTDL